MTTQLAEVYRKAAKVIRDNGHAKGSFFVLPESGVGIEPYPAECPVCVSGALSIALTGQPEPPETDTGDLEEYDEFYEAAEFLAARVDDRFTEDRLTDDGPVNSLAAWNDRPERTPEQVIAELLAAAEAVGGDR